MQILMNAKVATAVNIVVWTHQVASGVNAFVVSNSMETTGHAVVGVMHTMKDW